MAVTAEQSAPYAPPSVMIPLLQRNREKGLPNPVTAEALQRLGVSDSLVPRTLQTLKVLDLIGADGRHTGTLEALRRASEAEYQGLMTEWLNASYAHALDVIDPATADEVSIRDAFRHYSPVSLQPRMIKLFTALYVAAGVRAGERPKPAEKQPRLVAASRPMRNVRALPPRPALARMVSQRQPANLPDSGLHPALAGLLASLPSPDQGWTQDARDRFVIAFGVVLDFAYPPGVMPSANTAEADDADA